MDGKESNISNWNKLKDKLTSINIAEKKSCVETIHVHVEQQQTVFVKNNKFMEIASGNSKEEFFSLLMNITI